MSCRVLPPCHVAVRIPHAHADANSPVLLLPVLDAAARALVSVPMSTMMTMIMIIMSLCAAPFVAAENALTQM